MNEYKFIFRSPGQYLGFIYLGDLFSRDGAYLGWVDLRNFVWDKQGMFRGQVQDMSGHDYILKNTFSVEPIPQSPRIPPSPPPLPVQQNPIAPISLPLFIVDGF